MMKWINKKRNQKGFTLIELVVVIAILGILAALAIPRLTGSRQKAAITTHNANVRTLQSAGNIFVAEEGIPTTAVTWNGTDAEGSEDYLADWPKPVKGTGEALVDDVDYVVTIADDGKVTVAPGAIEE